MKSYIEEITEITSAITSVLSAAIVSLFGGWTSGIKVLLIMMGLDIITGITCSLMRKSDKTESGAYSSHVGWKGLVKKVITLILISVAYQLDVVMNTTIIRDSTVIFFIINEVSSILENAGRLGVKYPAVIQKALDVLNKKSEDSAIS